jgi:hypothetical protein
LEPRHASRCSVQPARNLGNLFEVTSYVKTGMSIDVITNKITEEIDTLKRYDVTVMCGAAIQGKIN